MAAIICRVDPESGHESGLSASWRAESRELGLWRMELVQAAILVERIARHGVGHMVAEQVDRPVGTVGPVCRGIVVPGAPVDAGRRREEWGARRSVG
jgi:hypothetical protein